MKLLPVVCTLNGVEMVDREAAWRSLLASSLVERRPIQGGVSLQVKPDAYLRLLELIELEKDCCAWINFEADGQSTVKMTADGPGALVLAKMFKRAEPEVRGTGTS
jgi:hypothetical protein